MQVRKRLRTPAKIGPAGQDPEAGAGRVDERAIEAAELRRQLGGVRADDVNVLRAEPANVLLELAHTALVDLDGGDFAAEHRGLAAGGGARVEHALAVPRADGERGELRRAALRPYASLFQRTLVDARDAIRTRNVGRLPVDLAAHQPHDRLSGLVLRSHQRERVFLAEIAHPHVVDPVGIGMLERSLRKRLEQRVHPLG